LQLLADTAKMQHCGDIITSQKICYSVNLHNGKDHLES
jgi:hypothetical protein